MAQEHLMRLGEYKFAIETAAYQQLKRTSEWHWPSQHRVWNEPAAQYTGKGDETLSLEGVIYPHYRGGLGQLQAMRAEADQGGVPLDLSDGQGNNWGKWVITRIEEGQSEFLAGGVPQKQTFRLQLKKYAEDLWPQQ